MVTGITSFGAFVKIDNRLEGLIHISEIANEYVTNVGNFVTLGDKIKVKVLGINKQRKYDLSLKKVDESSDVVKSVKKVHVKRDRGEQQDNQFEDKVSQFMKRSEEKLIDIKRNIQTKQGIKKRKKKR